MGKVLWFRIKKNLSEWVVGFFGDVYISIGCLTSLSIHLMTSNNRADFVAQSFIEFKWIVGSNTSL